MQQVSEPQNSSAILFLAEFALLFEDSSNLEVLWLETVEGAKIYT